MTQQRSRGIIGSMLVIGSAQAVNILISIVRMKLLAVLLGPSGVGLLSIYQNLQGTVAQSAGLGMAQSGVREIAAAKGEDETQGRVRQVLFAAHIVQGGLAILAVWLLREQISTWLFGDPTHETEVGLVSVSIFLTLMAAVQTALIHGMRRIKDLARVTVWGSIAGTIGGLAAVWNWGESGLIWFLLVQPLGTLIVALYYVRRIPRPAITRLSPHQVWDTWKPMATLGVSFMLGGLATTATLLVVRSRISQELGLDAAGNFAVASGITITYVGFLLNAMGADYYPRLTEIIRDQSAAVQLMNDQAQLSLAIGGPVLLLLIGLAPWLITLLYSAEFQPAVALLQWQTVGNVFKLASWALGFAIVALARNKTFLFVQINFNMVFLLLLWPTLSLFGIVSAGPAFTIAYIVHFALVILLVRRIVGFRWQPLSLVLLALHASLSIALLALALALPWAAALAAPILAIVTGLYGLRVVLIKVGPTGRIAGRAARLFVAIGWPVPNTK